MSSHFSEDRQMATRHMGRCSIIYDQEIQNKMTIRWEWHMSKEKNTKQKLKLRTICIGRDVVKKELSLTGGENAAWFNLPYGK